MTIEERVEQFKADWLCLIEGDDLPKVGDEFRGKLNDLLLSFLGECCEAECRWCKEGSPISKRKGRWMHDIGAPYYRNCDADNVRRHFAWLEKK